MDINLLGLLVNIGVIVFYIVMFFSGYKKGFVLQLINLIGLIIAIYLAWLLAPVFARTFPIVPQSALPLEGTVIAEFLQQYLSKIIWMILIVIVIKVLLFVIKPMVKVVKKLPVIKQLDGVLGAAFSLVTSTLWVLLFAMILSMPFIKVGSSIVENGLIGTIRNGAVKVVTVLEEPLLASEELNYFFENFDEISEEELEKFEEWMESVK